MNINLGDRNYFVRYIQAFLNEYYSKSLLINETYDVKTHRALKEYLNLPVTVSYDKFIEEMTDRFSYVTLDNIEIQPFSYWFKYKIGHKEITFTQKSVNENPELGQWMRSKMSEISYYGETLGWDMTEFNSYDSPYTIKFKTSKYTYEFPRDQVKNTVNLFEEEFMYNKAIISDFGETGRVHDNNSGKTKVTVIDCNPDTYYTICFSSSYNTKFVVGCSNLSDKENIGLVRLADFTQEVTTSSGKPFVYKTTSDAKLLVIQVPSSDLKETIKPSKSDDSKEDEETNIKDMLILEGNYEDSKYNIQFKEYVNNPWILHDKFLGFICKRTITMCSEPSDIYDVQKLIQDMFPSLYKIDYPETYDDNLREIIRQIQEEKSVSFVSGFVDTETETILVRMATEREINYE